MGRKVYKFTGTRKLYDTRPSNSLNEELSDEMKGIFSDEENKTENNTAGANTLSNNFLKESMNMNPNIMELGAMQQQSVPFMETGMQQQMMPQQPMMPSQMMQQPILQPMDSEIDPSMNLDPSQYLHMGNIRKNHLAQTINQNIDPAQLAHLNKVNTMPVNNILPTDYVNSIDMMGLQKNVNLNNTNTNPNLKMLGNIGSNIGSSITTPNDLTQLGVMSADMNALPATNSVQSFLKQGL
jgi:hypothetical protein